MDPWVVARIGAELQRDWRGAWVQAAWASPERGVVLRLRGRGRTGLLALSLDPPGVGLLERRPPAPPRPPALASYLRAHAVGGRLEAVGWVPFDRVVWLAVRKGEEVGCRLVWEAAGRAPLLLGLGPDGAVRAMLHGPGSRPRKGVGPGRPYEPPPVPEGVRRPDECTAEEVVGFLASGVSLERKLFGFTPALARELERRLGAGDPAGVWARWLAGYGRPGPVWEYPEGLSAVERGDRQPRARWESALEAGGSWISRRAGAPEGPPEPTAGAAAARARRRIERRVRNIERDLTALPDPAALRRLGDALAANLHRVSPGAERVSLADPWTGGTVEIDLDPSLTPAANLERLYRTAAKAERGREILAGRLEEARRALETAEGDGPQGAGQGGREQKNPARPYGRYRSSDGWEIWVGRNGRENDRLVREARPWDLWLHARDGAGAHVLVRKPGREARCPERTLLEAAGLAALRSRRAGEAAVEVMVVEAGRLRKPKGSAPGRVLVQGERTLRVRPGWGGPRPLG